MQAETLNRMLRAADIVEIQMLQSKYLAYLDQVDFLGIYGLMAQGHPEICYEMCEDGARVGPDAVKDFLENCHESNRNNPKRMRGWVGLQYLYTPRIVLNDDATRARAQFNQLSPHAMRITPYPGDERECTAYWFIGKYDNEYIKIENEWKLLKVHILAYSRTAYDEGWLRQPDARRILHADADAPQHKPRIYTYHSDATYTPHGNWNWGPHLPKDGLPSSQMGFGWE